AHVRAGLRRRHHRRSPIVRRGVTMQANRPHEPAYGGIPTVSDLPLVLDPSDLAGVDVAIVGAPIDETVSNRPGSRYGPRAIRAADDSARVPPSRPHMWLPPPPTAPAPA